MSASEEFWICTDKNCASVHHYASPVCQRCKKPVKKRTVETVKDLQELLGIEFPKPNKKGTR